MAQFPPGRVDVQTAQVVTRKPVSELLVQAVAGTTNHYLNRSREPMKLTINGNYSGNTNIFGVDGLLTFDFDITIWNVIIYSNITGATGQTELDLKVGTSGSTYASIFSTTPKAVAGHPDYSYVPVGGTSTGLVAAILATPDIDAGQALRFDLLTSMTGTPDTCGLLINWFKR